MPLLATLCHGVSANLVLGLVVALGWMSSGLPSGGSFVAGAATAATGPTCFAATLLAAQLFHTGRGANTAGVIFVLTVYLLRGIGDATGPTSADLEHVTPTWVSWLSPIGYGQFTGAFVTNNWLPLVVPLSVSTLLLVVIVRLQQVRDQGDALLPARQVRPEAGRSLHSSLGLAWRLNTTPAVVWLVAGVCTGLLTTSLAGLLGTMQSDPSTSVALHQIAQLMGGASSIEQAFVGAFFEMIGILAACAAVQIGLKLRQEEARGTAEVVLATPVRRDRWLAEYGIVGAAVIVGLLVGSMLAALVGVGAATDPGALAGTVVGAAVAQAPVAVIYLGVTLFVCAVLPRAAVGVSWAVVAASAVIGVWGPLFRFPDWLVRLSLFADSSIPGGTTAWWAGLIMLGVAIVLTVAGVTAARYRELVTG